MTRWGLLLAGAAALAAGAAQADAIDGAWCSADGRRLSIQGSNIVTPGGTAMVGRYGRHDFSYDTPASEPQGGAPVMMLLQSETRMQRRVGDGAQEEWRRCPPGIS